MIKYATAIGVGVVTVWQWWILPVLAVLFVLLALCYPRLWCRLGFHDRQWDTRSGIITCTCKRPGCYWEDTL